MESDAERGFGSAENDGEELSPVLTTMSLNRGMDSIVAKAGTLSTLENIKGIIHGDRTCGTEPGGRGGPRPLPPPNGPFCALCAVVVWCGCA